MRGGPVGAKGLDLVVGSVDRRHAFGVQRAMALAGAVRQELEMAGRVRLEARDFPPAGAHGEQNDIAVQPAALGRGNSRARHGHGLHRAVAVGKRSRECALAVHDGELQGGGVAVHCGARDVGSRDQVRVRAGGDFLHIAVGIELHQHFVGRILHFAGGVVSAAGGLLGQHPADHSLLEVDDGAAGRVQLVVLAGEPSPVVEQHHRLPLAVDQFAGFEFHGLDRGAAAAPMQLHLAVHDQLAEVGIVDRSDGLAVAQVEGEVGLPLGGGPAGLDVEADSGTVDVEQAPVRRAVERHPQGHIDLAVGVEVVVVLVELRPGAADAIVALAIRFDQPHLHILEIQPVRFVQLPEVLGAELGDQALAIVLVVDPTGGRGGGVEGERFGRRRGLPEKGGLLAVIRGSDRAEDQDNGQEQQQARAP